MFFLHLIIHSDFNSSLIKYLANKYNLYFGVIYSNFTLEEDSFSL